MNILRLLSRQLGSCLLAAVALAAPMSANAAVIALTASSSNVAVGQNFSVDFRINGLSGAAGDSLGGFDLDALYDPSALQFVGFSFTDGAQNQLDLPEQDTLGFAGAAFDAAGRIDVFGISGNSPVVLDAGQAGDFRFLSLQFKAIAARAGTAIAIDLMDPNLLFLDSGINLLNVNYASSRALVTIGQVAQVPEPRSILLLVLGGAALVLSSPRRRRALRGAAASALVVFAIAPAAAQSPAPQPSSPVPRPASAHTAEGQSGLAGVVMAVRGKRMQLRLPNGEQRWVSVDRELSDADIGKKVSGRVVSRGDTVLMSELSLSN